MDVQKNILVICHFLISNSIGQQDDACPSPASLHGFPTLSQIDSLTIQVDWSDVITSSNLKDCIDEVIIVAKPAKKGERESDAVVNKSVSTFPFGLKKEEVCENINIKVKFKINGLADYIESALSSITSYDDEPIFVEKF